MTSLISISDVLNSELHREILWPDEIEKLFAGSESALPFYAAVEINKDYFSRWQKLIYEQKERRGEVALVVRNLQEHILLHTKPFYPDGILRIPTGGIQSDESVVGAMFRELQEETSFSPISFQFRSLLLYEFKNGSQSIPFASYLFDIAPDGVIPEAGDAGEHISGFLWSPLSDMPVFIQKLRSLDGYFWQDWGKVRVIPHEIYFQNSSRWQEG